MADADLQARFHEVMLGIYDEASTFGYRPSYFLRMVHEHGGVQAAEILLAGDSPSEGFVRLWEEGRLDISVEAMVLREPWRGLFADKQLREAYRRLAGSDYDPGEPP